LGLLKGSKKFLHYKRDLLTQDRIDEIESRRADLKAAIKSKDLDAVKETSKQVHNTCEKSLAHYKSPTWLEENIEVFWVAIVVALGIRAYFLQPFRIPTGSMQPSLNGIIAESMHEEKDWEKPFIGSRVFDFILEGKSYENIVADKPKSIVGIKDSTVFLFSGTTIAFDDGSTERIGCPPNEAVRIPTIGRFVRNTSQGYIFASGVHYQKGDPIFQGSLTSGDLVLVDKVSYHFRNPKRGESFVFDTRGIDTDGTGKHMSSQQGGTHYIKRLVGVPGDTLQVKEPDLYINGALAKEETILRVAGQGKDAKGRPYPGYSNPKQGKSSFMDQDFVFNLKSIEETEDTNMREFFAMGDNSPSSLDSRFWGTVKQHNLVGPAYFALWPFTSGHWGFIK
jgi:signal peptidase I